jgi:hypothetical protein
MEPLILKFAESPTPTPFDEDNEFEYSEALNLNVLKKTGKPAIQNSSLATSTGTRASKENTDTDRTFSIPIAVLATESFTKASGEGTDTDRS